MIRETQTLIALGNQDILNAIRNLNSEEAQRSARGSMTILETLVRKHMIDGHEYDHNDYSATCGYAFSNCNIAFIDLCSKFEDILGASHNDVPRGELKRIRAVGDNIMTLLTNSMYSLSWLNAKYYNETHPANPVDTKNIGQVRIASQADTLEFNYKEKAVASYERWTVVKAFHTCRMCTSCGGDYKTYSGEGMKRDDWGHWLRHREECSADLYSESGPPRLCCSVEQPPCQYCKSCGGEYPNQVGRKYNRDDWGPYMMKDHQCGGNDWIDSAEEFDICCRTKRQCKLCGGDCKSPYIKVGKVERIDDWGIWGAYDENSCTPDYNGVINTERSADVSFCCLDYTSNLPQ